MKFKKNRIIQYGLLFIIILLVIPGVFGLFEDKVYDAASDTITWRDWLNKPLINVTLQENTYLCGEECYFIINPVKINKDATPTMKLNFYGAEVKDLKYYQEESYIWNEVIGMDCSKTIENKSAKDGFSNICEYTTIPIEKKEWKVTNVNNIDFSKRIKVVGYKDKFANTDWAIELYGIDTKQEWANWTGQITINSPGNTSYNIQSIQTNISLGLGVSSGGYVLHESYNTSDNTISDCSNTHYSAQSFTVGANGTNADFNISSVKLKIYKVGTPGTFTVDLYLADINHKPTGSVLSTGTTNGNDLTASAPGLWYEITMSAYNLEASTEYVLVGRAGAGEVDWRYDSAGSTYAGGTYLYSDNSGSTWTDYGGDLMFEVYGGSALFNNQGTTWFSNDTGNTTYISVQNYTWSFGSHKLTAYANDTSNVVNSTSVWFYINQLPRINFTTPTTNAGNYSTSSIWANVTSVDDNYANVTIYLFNRTGLYEKESSTGLSYFFNFTSLPDNTYYLNATATDLMGSINSTATRIFTIDTVSPVLTILNPVLSTTYVLPSNIWLNYTASDSNLGSCWFSVNTGVTNYTLPSCGNTTINGNVTYLGNNSLYLWVNDTTNNVIFNHTSFNVLPTLSLCNSTVTQTAYNVTFKDESNSSYIPASIITGTNIVYWYDNQNTNLTYSFLNATENLNYTICIYPNWASATSMNNFIYSNTAYQQRTNSFELSLNNNTQSKILYLLLSSEGNFGRFQVIDSSIGVLEGVRVVMSNPSTGLIYETEYTDASGMATFFIDYDSTYAYEFSKDGYITQSTSLRITSFDINSIYLVPTGGTGGGEQQNSQYGITYNIYPTILNAAIDTVYFALSSSNKTISNWGMNLYNGTNILDTNTSTDNGGLMSITYNFTDYDGYFIGGNFWFIIEGNYTGWNESFIVGLNINPAANITNQTLYGLLDNLKDFQMDDTPVKDRIDKGLFAIFLTALIMCGISGLGLATGYSFSGNVLIFIGIFVMATFSYIGFFTFTGFGNAFFNKWSFQFIITMLGLALAFNKEDF